MVFDDTTLGALSRLGLPVTADVVAAVRAALEARSTHARAAPEALGLLLSAEHLGPGGSGGARCLLDRLETAGRGNDLDRLAGSVGVTAATSPHPAHVYSAVARWILDSTLPLMSDDAYAGLARTAAAECRINARREAIAEGFVADRRHKALRETAEWTALVAGIAAPGVDHGERFAAILQALTTEDVDALVDICAGGSHEDEVRLCLSLLTCLRRTRDPRLSVLQGARWRQCLRERVPSGVSGLWCEDNVWRAWALVDREGLNRELVARYERSGRLDLRLLQLVADARDVTPSERRDSAAHVARIVAAEFAAGRVTPQAVGHWIVLDRRSATRFLTTKVQLGALPLVAQRVVIEALRQLASRAAIACLRRTHAEGGEVACDALVALEVLGAVDQERIEALAQKWREQRSRASLLAFHTVYLEKIPMGSKFARWRERLGLSGFERTFWVRPTDGPGGLYVELDRTGRLTSLSCT